MIASPHRMPAGVVDAYTKVKAAAEALAAHWAISEQEPWAHDRAAWNDEHDRLTRIEYAELSGLFGAVGYHVGAALQESTVTAG